MPNKIYFTCEYHAKTATGLYIHAYKPHPTVDVDEWDVIVYNDQRHPLREYSGWDEVRVLSFMEFFDSGDD